MTLEEKDAYIAEHLMKLSPETLRYMVADLTAAVESMFKQPDGPPYCSLKDAEIACGVHYRKGLERAAEIADEWTGCDLLAAAIRKESVRG